MATWTNSSRNTASYDNPLRHGVEPRLGDMDDKTFNDPIFDDGLTAIKDLTFQELQGQAYTNQSRNSASFTNTSRN